ncbi:kyphoscoliosis peptidase-like isoform X6 [Scyliorhinus torazame]|uniref:kyphoscoliosis peptidase-like isoform X6 n=1 Tax=Scyliorhinus torazame TaxID=75743 RepID=UPI003B591182
MATESTFDRFLKILVAIICLPFLPLWFCFVYIQRLLESPGNEFPETDRSTSEEDNDNVQMVRRHKEHGKYTKRPHRSDKSPYPVPMGYQARKPTLSLYSESTETSDEDENEAPEKYPKKGPGRQTGKDGEKHRGIEGEKHRGSEREKHRERDRTRDVRKDKGRKQSEGRYSIDPLSSGGKQDDDSINMGGKLAKDTNDVDSVNLGELSTKKKPRILTFAKKGKAIQELDTPTASEFSQIPEKNAKGEEVEEFLIERPSIYKDEGKKEKAEIEDSSEKKSTVVNSKGKRSKKKHEATSDKNKVSLEVQDSANSQKYKLKEIKDDVFRLKSIKIDLTEFEALDTYACKVRPKQNVQKLVKELLLFATSDLEKIRVMWIWICCHIEYDVKGYHTKNLKHDGPNDVLKSGKAVCAGYSGLFCEMCSLAGIECTTIEGYSKGYNYEIGKTFSGEPDHAWNAVFLDGRWHLLDSTWGAGHVNETCTKFTFKYVEFYFFTHPTLFINNHFPTDENWQLVSPKISLKVFENMVFRTGEFYDIGLTYIHPDVQVVSTVNGRVIINVEGQYPTYFIFNLDGKKDCAILTITKYGMKLEVLPEKTGEFKLKIYAKLWDTKEETFSFVCAYLIKCDFIDENFRLPKAFHNPLGPSWITENKGLLRPTHPEPIIYCEDGKCRIRFMLNKDLSFTSRLSCDEVKLSDEAMRNHVFKTQQGNWIEFQVHLPTAGLYVFAIFAKEKSNHSPTHEHVCEYLISCRNRNVHWPGFPKIFSSWTEGCELIEPLSGILPRNQMVTFKLKIPHMRKVHVHGKTACPLTLSKEGYWEGRCYTQEAKYISIGVSDKMFDTKFTFALQYEIADT